MLYRANLIGSRDKTNHKLLTAIFILMIFFKYRNTYFKPVCT